MARANLRRLEEGKLYYSISEVCAMTGLEQHVLRYWESEFPQLRPKKNRSGNRAYRNKEIKIIRYIKYLLYDELYTIPGAKKKMSEANLADLEGQMSLIRVPAAPVRAPETSPPAPAAAQAVGEAEAADEAETVDEAGETVDPDGMGSEAPKGFPEPVPGPEDVAGERRLRGELLRLRDELKRLLALLQAGNAARPGDGPGSPAAPADAGADLAVSSPEPANGRRRIP